MVIFRSTDPKYRFRYQSTAINTEVPIIGLLITGLMIDQKWIKVLYFNGIDTHSGETTLSKLFCCSKKGVLTKGKTFLPVEEECPRIATIIDHAYQWHQEDLLL